MRTGSKRLIRWLAITVFLAFILPAGMAGETTNGAIKVSGTVKIVDRTGQEPKTAVMESDQGVSYNLELDEKGRSLAKVMHKEKAEILGVPSERDGRKWLKVLGYPDPRLTAAHELWRRSRCNACVVFPANVNSTPPTNLHGADLICGRQYFQKERIMAWTHDPEFLWLATDNRVMQISLEQRRLLRSFDMKDGLPDNWIYQLASDGKTLWIVYRGGVAMLDVASGAIRDVAALKSQYARVVAGPAGAWVLTDAGTFRFSPAAKEPAPFPAIPTGERIRKAVENGIWTPHWGRRTAHFLATPASLGDSLYVQSYGDVYGLEDGRWKKVAPLGWELAVGAGRLWFLTPKGLGEYRPESKTTNLSVPPDLGHGRLSHLLIAGDSAWLAVEPMEVSETQNPGGGGLARLEMGAGKWTVWRQIQQADATHVACLGAGDRDVWVVTMSGAYKTKPAHPGMTYVKKRVFETGGFVLNRFDPDKSEWTTLPLNLVDVDQRLICGQDGNRGMDKIAPRTMEGISVGPQSIFASVRLVPREFFGGYWPSVTRIASASGVDRTWTAGFVQYSEELDLDGEQPLVLNISNGELIINPQDVGERVLEAVGHDNVLGLFVHKGGQWAVTEGCAGWYDAAAGHWNKAIETGARYYWRATGAADDGRYLYVGSDRGLISRMDLRTGQFETLAVMPHRSVVGVARGQTGEIIVRGGQDPLGRLPDRLLLPKVALDSDDAVFDGKNWKPGRKEDGLPPDVEPKWLFKQLEKRNDFDKSDGNFLVGPAPDGSGQKPRYYVKEVFFPRFLCLSPDGKRLWISTFNGLLRLDLPGT